MGNRMQALITLRDKVNAGERLIQPYHFQDVFNNAGHRNCAGEASGAYHGRSLDYANAVHEIVLPDHGWSIEGPFSNRFLCKVSYNEDEVIGLGMNPSPARAWLLAILGSLKNQEGAANG